MSEPPTSRIHAPKWVKHAKIGPELPMEAISDPRFACFSARRCGEGVARDLSLAAVRPPAPKPFPGIVRALSEFRDFQGCASSATSKLTLAPSGGVAWVARWGRSNYRPGMGGCVVEADCGGERRATRKLAEKLLATHPGGS